MCDSGSSKTGQTGLIALVWVVLWTGCGQPREETTMSDTEIRSFDVQGHRGSRGYRPENTLPAFEYALGLGVSTLELDVIISSDSVVVVSHDPFLNSSICSHPDGTPVLKEEEATLRLFDMPWARISTYDCGKRGNPRFPEQQAMATSKPRLSDVFTMAEDVSGGTIQYNIETKSTPAGDGIVHPVPDRFVGLLYEEIERAGVKDRVTVQSFDPRTLQALRSVDSDMKTALLIATSTDLGLKENLHMLGFIPTYYSPDFTLVTPELVAGVHDAGMLLLPWTVNEESDIRKMIGLGVDGLISDYPDRVLSEIRNGEENRL